MPDASQSLGHPARPTTNQSVSQGPQTLQENWPAFPPPEGGGRKKWLLEPEG